MGVLFNLLSWAVSLYGLALFVRFVMQWFDKDGTNNLNTALKPYTEPVMEPLRKYLVLGGIDFSAVGASFLITLAFNIIVSVL